MKPYCQAHTAARSGGGRGGEGERSIFLQVLRGASGDLGGWSGAPGGKTLGHVTFPDRLPLLLGKFYFYLIEWNVSAQF